MSGIKQSRYACTHPILSLFWQTCNRQIRILSFESGLIFQLRWNLEVFTQSLFQLYMLIISLQDLSKTSA